MIKKLFRKMSEKVATRMRKNHYESNTFVIGYKIFSGWNTRKFRVSDYTNNGNEIYLPPNITSVPTLLLLNKGNKLLVGDDVSNYFRPQIMGEKTKAVPNNMEPLAFSGYEMGTCMSDTYSYLDQSPDEMNAKGEGGLRQMHSFVQLNQTDRIDTPPEDYEPDKVGEVDMGKLQAAREADISLPPMHKI